MGRLALIYWLLLEHCYHLAATLGGTEKPNQLATLRLFERRTEIAPLRGHPLGRRQRGSFDFPARLYKEAKHVMEPLRNL